MTPILVRPVREQLEHDRVIRLLQARWRRKYAVGINQGAEQLAGVTAGESVLYPDVILTPPGRNRRPEIIVEVETAESVNNLEAMAEWVRLAHARAEFHLYVPAGSVDAARRLCTEHGVPVAEICSYHAIGDQMRFVTVFKAPPGKPASHAAPAARRPAASGRTAAPRRPSGSGAPKSASRRAAKAAAKRSRTKKAAPKAARSQKRK